MSKAQALWNRQNHKVVCAFSTKNQLGRKLVTPCATRWNSIYDSVSVLHSMLLAKQREINNICIKGTVFENESQNIVTD